MPSFSQGFLEYLAGKEIASYTAATLALVDGGGSADTITDSANQFVAEGFEAGCWVEVSGATDSDDEGEYLVTAAAVGTLSLPTGSWTTGEAAGASITLKAVKPYNIRRLLYNCWLSIFSSTKPTSSDAAENGTELISISGINNWKDVAWDSVNKKATIETNETFGDTSADASGQAQWARLYCLAKTTGASTTAARVDFTVSTSSGLGEIILSSQSITAGQSYDMSSIYIRLPQA